MQKESVFVMQANLRNSVQKFLILELFCTEFIVLGLFTPKPKEDSFPENKVLKDEFSGKSSSFIQVFRPIPTIWLILDSNDGNFSSLVSKVHYFSIFYGY